PWAAGAAAFFALARAAGAALWIVEYALPVPRLALALLAALYFLLSENGYLAAEYGLDSPPFALILGVFIAIYFASASGRSGEVIAAFLGEERRGDGFRWARVASNLSIVAAASVAALALMETLPPLNAALIEMDPNSLLGKALEVYIERIHPLRGYIVGLVASLLAAWSLAPLTAQAEGIGVGPFLQSGLLSVAAVLSWIVGSELAEVGQGFSLAGAMAATGLFLLALTRLSLYAMSSSSPVVSEVAMWLAASKPRAFFLGASVAFYGLFLRPHFYHRMWFAPLYEWMLVIALAALILVKTNRRIRRSITPARDASRSASWSRHEQTVRQLPDLYFSGVASLQQQFIETGEIRGLWCYMMMVLFQNNAPLQAIPRVVEPLVSYPDAPSAWKSWSESRRSPEEKGRAARQEALNKSLRRMEEAMSMRPEARRPADAGALQSAAQGFLDASATLPFVVALVGASWQHGGNLASSAIRWMRLLYYADRPIKWHHLPWQRSRIRRDNQVRRQELVEDSIQQALDSDANSRVYVGYPTYPRPLRAEPSTRSKIVAMLEPNSLVEVRGMVDEFYSVCTFANVRGYIGSIGGGLRASAPWRFESRY
ncbi:MAG: SH3 domain-containing protein, partial [Chloroflexi bacterium]|nr:SH3 domain-containing protein [Chloroflexota bacterium]